MSGLAQSWSGRRIVLAVRLTRQLGWRSPYVSTFHLCHVPQSDCFADEGEKLDIFKAEGPSKRAAKEAAAKLMALSGHCVSMKMPLKVHYAHKP